VCSLQKAGTEKGGVGFRFEILPQISNIVLSIDSYFLHFETMDMSYKRLSKKFPKEKCRKSKNFRKVMT
jgi:hypothetical protein